MVRRLAEGSATDLLYSILILTLVTSARSAYAGSDTPSTGPSSSNQPTDSKLTPPNVGLGVDPYVEFAGSLGSLGNDIGASAGLLHDWHCTDDESRMQLRVGLDFDVARFGVPQGRGLPPLPTMFLWGGEVELGMRLPRTVARLGPYLSLQSGGSDTSGTDYSGTLVMAGVRLRYDSASLGVELTHAWSWETEDRSKFFDLGTGVAVTAGVSAEHHPGTQLVVLSAVVAIIGVGVLFRSVGEAIGG